MRDNTEDHLLDRLDRRRALERRPRPEPARSTSTSPPPRLGALRREVEIRPSPKHPRQQTPALKAPDAESDLAAVFAMFEPEPERRCSKCACRIREGEPIIWDAPAGRPFCSACAMARARAIEIPRLSEVAP